MDDKLAKVKDPLLTAVRWLKGRSQSEKLGLACVGAVLVSGSNALPCIQVDVLM